MFLWVLGLLRTGQGETVCEQEQGGGSDSGTSQMRKLLLTHAERVSYLVRRLDS